MSALSITKGVLKYSVMPEIMPRVKSLMFNGFGYIPFFIATVYQMVGLLPRNHPYLDGRNIGRFGIRHVIAQAALNINFSWKNIDQIVLFFGILAGMIIFCVQFFAIASIFLFQPVYALPTNWADFYQVAIPEQDLAYMMLDMVFGVPHPSLGATGFFESCASTTAACDAFVAPGQAVTPIPGMNLANIAGFAGPADNLSLLVPTSTFPMPFHNGLHTLFGMYSTALLIIAVGITMYFVATVLGETAQSGTPFGRRFNKTWAPLRIVVAFGLLIPLGVGLNSSQYLVLYAAKYGSAFATNGWRHFSDTLTTSFFGSGQRLIATPNVPEMNELTKFMFVARTCRYVHNFYQRGRLGLAVGTPLPDNQRVRAYVLLQGTDAINTLPVTAATSYVDVANALAVNTQYVKIRFGIENDALYKEHHSHVSPVCGEVTLPWVDGRNASGGGPQGVQEQYVRTIQEAFFFVVRDLWHDDIWNGVNGNEGTTTQFPNYMAGGVELHNGNATPAGNRRYIYIADGGVEGLPYANATVVAGRDVNHSVALNATYAQRINGIVEGRMTVAVATSVTEAVNSGYWGGFYNGTINANADPLTNRGWAAAGIWYNRIAQINGEMSSAAFSTPRVTTWPAIMESVSDAKAKYDSTLDPSERFKPVAASVDDIGTLLDSAVGREYAAVLYTAYEEWDKASGVASSTRPAGNPILSFLREILGLSGLYNMYENTNAPGSRTHPLAQLAGVGRSLVESSIRSLGYATIATAMGIPQGAPKQLLGVIANFFVTMAMLGLTVGFVLFYVVPFLPFIYFFFAVGGWIKGIFEAMVGAPLWALAHIRIDGNGLPGNAALNGYFLIFEVFLRPILIVFGMLASISTYSALVNVLNNIFSLVVENAAGYDVQSELTNPRFTLSYTRGLIDEFFFTVIYAIIVYMLGMSSFKLVDTMPNNILRWMGQSVATFGDQREDPAQSLVSRASIGSQQVLGKIGGGLQSIVGAATRE